MTKREKHKRLLALVMFMVFLCFGVALFIYWEPIAIRYHKQRVKALLNKKPKYDTDSGLSYFDEDWVRALEVHRNKLVRLGYLQRKEIALNSIKTPSLRFRRLWEELGARFPDNPHVEGHGYESNSPATIIIWEEEAKLPEWESIILAHDALSTNIVSVGKQIDPQDLLAFVGHWANDEGEVCYIISKDIEGNVRIKTPPNDAWQTVFRNARFEDKRILFDEFTYIEPNEDYKSKIDPSGEHPFSGVRCSTAFEINPKDSNELYETVSMVSKYDTSTDPNKGILRRLK